MTRGEIEALAQGTAPISFEAGAEIEPYEPFPVDLLPEPLRSFVNIGAIAMCCDPSYIALPLLAASASVMPRRATTTPRDCRVSTRSK